MPRCTLQNAAIKKIIDRDGFSALPELADDLVREFLAANAAPNITFVDRPFIAAARWQVRTTIRPLPDSLRPVVVI